MSDGRQCDPCLYVFLDEAGNFDFSPNGTRYLVFTCVSAVRPLSLCGELHSLKFDLVEQGLEVEYFHASEDRQAVRDQVFAAITGHLAAMRVDSLIVEKAKTPPALRPVVRFYPKMLGHLLRRALSAQELTRFRKVVAYTDVLPVRKTRRAVEKATKTQMARRLPASTSYVVLHHGSMSNPYLQVADYVNWAIYRKWDRADTRSYDLVRQAVRTEVDLFRHGTRRYY
jgi:hypothetical protein